MPVRIRAGTALTLPNPNPDPTPTPILTPTLTLTLTLIVQALQLLGWCAGSPLEEMRQYLPQELLSSLLEATDVTQAVLRLTPDTIVATRALLEPFLLANQPSRGELAPEVDDDDEIDLDSPDSPEPGDSNAQPDLV